MRMPSADDVVLSYQSTSFQDALHLLGLKRASEFERWLQPIRITDRQAGLRPVGLSHPLWVRPAPARLQA